MSDYSLLLKEYVEKERQYLELQRDLEVVKAYFHDFFKTMRWDRYKDDETGIEVKKVTKIIHKPDVDILNMLLKPSQLKTVMKPHTQESIIIVSPEKKDAIKETINSLRR